MESVQKHIDANWCAGTQFDRKSSDNNKKELLKRFEIGNNLFNVIDFVLQF